MVQATPPHHPGYLSSVEDERYQIISEMVAIPLPPPSSKPLLEIIFDDRLTREFRTKYEDKFGRSQAHRDVIAPNKFDEYQLGNGQSVSLLEDRRQKQRFGEYMFRRLSEHHIDLFMKSKPEMRTVYELKDRISKVNVQVAKSYKLKIDYSFSGNFIDFRLDNPLDLDSRIRMQMNDGGFGPSKPTEIIYSLGWQALSNLSLSTFYHQLDGKMTVVAARSLAPSLVATLTGARYWGDKPQDKDRQDLLLLGFTVTR